MTSPVCDLCGCWIEMSNRKHPGYCSPKCRDSHQLHREQQRAANRHALRKPTDADFWSAR